MARKGRFPNTPQPTQRFSAFRNRSLLAWPLYSSAGMDKDTQSWLIGVPFEAQENHEPRETPVLSRRQKRELACVTGLVMASIAFFLTPLFSSATARSEMTQASSASESVVAYATHVDAEVRPTSTIKRASNNPRPRAGARRKNPAGLLRAFIGNGRYRVQPFPTPVTGD